MLQSITAAEIEPIAVGHRRAHGIVFFKSIAAKIEPVQPPGRGGTHADHVNIERAVSVKVSHRVSHAKSVALLDPVVGDIGEFSLALVSVNVDPGKVADTEQIEIIIPVEIRE